MDRAEPGVLADLGEQLKERSENYPAVPEGLAADVARGLGSTAPYLAAAFIFARGTRRWLAKPESRAR